MSIDDLIRERLGPGERFAIFFATGEGRHMPNGEEVSSGCVVTASGKHYFFWVGWDDETGAETLSEWDELPQSEWADSDEYRDALRLVGRLP